MTEKELRRLRRSDLLEILLEQNREIDRLKEQLEKLNAIVESRVIEMETAGSIAEAALKLNGVFQAAEAACEQYRLSVEIRCEQQKRICEQMERQAKEQCDEMIANAREEAERILKEEKSDCPERQHSEPETD